MSCVAVVQTPMTETLLTVAQACKVLGISERTLRRILREPEMAARIQAKDRQTRTGLRRSSLLTPELVSEIAIRANALNSQAFDINEYTGKRPAQLVQMYETLLAEKDQRIADLTAALNHERAQSRRHSEALAQAQEFLGQANGPVQKPQSGWRRWFGVSGKPHQ